MKYEFSKIDNFRDLGGIVSVDGRKIVQGRLLRSGDLSKLTEEDIKILKEKYKLLNIVDLRTENERLESPDCKIQGTRYLSLDFFANESAGKATGSVGQFKEMQSVEQIHTRMEELYASFITDINVRRKIYEFLQLLIQTENGSTLFHCFAGKDRTGITAAVILTVLGAQTESIIEDYLETNKLRQKANKIIIDSMKEAGHPETVQQAVLAALSVEQRYLDTSYKMAEKEYGSFEEYISEGIGLGEEDWKRLQGMYLA